jgi:hypothetical protein
MASEYLDTVISYGGSPISVGALMAKMQADGRDQYLIDRYIQGALLAKRVCDEYYGERMTVDRYRDRELF